MSAVLPQAIDLEESILGAMMIDKKGVDEVVELLHKDVFYKENHAVIYEAIRELYIQNNPIDLLTVSNQLKKTGKLDVAGGDFYLIGLTQKISSSAHIEFHSRIILQKFIQRRLIDASSKISSDSYKDDIDVLELLDETYKKLGDVSDLINIGSTTDFKKEVLKYELKKSKTTQGVPSSISRLNRKLGGYQKTDLIIIAARPGMGKTALALNEILECALSGIPVAFFSLEMSTEQIIGRLLSIVSGINSEKIKNRDLTDSEISYLVKCRELISNLPIYIDDTASLSTIDFKLKAKRLKREFNIEMIWLDYLQLMTVKDKKSFNRENVVSEISSTLKAVAKELNVPVASLSQLSRDVEKRGGSKRPLLSDLRESGSIEQDADCVMFIYRPEYYKIDIWDDGDNTSTKDEAEIDIQKYRSGKTGVTKVGCVLEYMRFMDLEHKYADLTPKYFRSNNNYSIEVPLGNPNDAFDISDDTDEIDF